MRFVLPLLRPAESTSPLAAGFVGSVMRKLLVVTFALASLPGMLGCQCCRALLECEHDKNQWLKDHFCCHHNRVDPVVAPLVAVPAVAAVAPVAVAPPAQPVPYICRGLPARGGLPAGGRLPAGLSARPSVRPLPFARRWQCCPPVQQCCPPSTVIYDPPGNCCQPMCCP